MVTEKSMFPTLPEEIERYIWKIYYSTYICQEVNSVAHTKIWDNPSDTLIANCEDQGSYQHTHSDLEKYLCCDDDIHEAVLSCFSDKCENCIGLGFPCLNAQIHGNLSPKIRGIWRIE